MTSGEGTRRTAGSGAPGATGATSDAGAAGDSRVPAGARPGRSDPPTRSPVDRRRQALGAYGEHVAATHLAERGLQILDRNWRSREGEIDIVARDGACLVVCEVKTRRTLAYGSPLEAVTWRKAARLRRLAGSWVQDHPELTRVTREVRVDVVGVVLPYGGAPQVQHLVGVLS